MRIAIRADASIQMGSGHLMRCLTLADALRVQGASSHFITRDLPGQLSAEIARRGHTFSLLSPQTEADAALAAEGPYAVWHGATSAQDALQTADALNEHGAIDALIVDAYGFGIDWERSLSPLAPVLLVVDDLPGRGHDCDLLLDPNLPLPGRSRQRDAPSALCLEGPRFAPLRHEFVEWREHSLLRRAQPTLNKIVLFMGGSDAPNASLTLLSAIPEESWEVEVLIGAANPHRSELEAYAATHPRVTATFNSPNVAERLASADLAIGAAGASAWERCCLGLPSLCLSLEANQTRIAAELSRREAAIDLGLLSEFDAAAFATTLTELRADAARCAELSRNAAEIVDGRGTERVLEALTKRAARPVSRAPIQLTRAAATDSERVFKWRNDARIRKFSHDPSELDFDGHRAWFESTLTRSDRELLIAEQEGAPLGVLRYDLNGTDAKISVYLTPERIGSGLGSRLIHAGTEWLSQVRPNVRRILAEIVAGNVASEKAFTRAGYEPLQPGLFFRAMPQVAQTSSKELSS